MDIAKQRNFLLSEIKINNPLNKIYLGLNNNNKFTGLLKIKGYKDPNEVLDYIKSYFNDENWFISDMEIPHNFNYVYLSGDGEVYFTHNFTNFTDEGKSEESFGVIKWKYI